MGIGMEMEMAALQCYLCASEHYSGGKEGS